MLVAIMELLTLRYCMLDSDSMATRHSNSCAEIPPEATLVTANAAEVIGGAAVIAADRALEML